MSVRNFKIYAKAFPNYNHIVHLCKSNQGVNILGGEHIYNDHAYWQEHLISIVSYIYQSFETPDHATILY